MSTGAKIRIEYVWDDGSWGFVVPALHIVGGGPSREAARHRAREAIVFALEADEAEDGAGDAELLNVELG